LTPSSFINNTRIEWSSASAGQYAEQAATPVIFFHATLQSSFLRPSAIHTGWPFVRRHLHGRLRQDNIIEASRLATSVNGTGLASRSRRGRHRCRRAPLPVDDAYMPLAGLDAATFSLYVITVILLPPVGTVSSLSSH